MLDADARERVGRIEALLDRVDALPDPTARETATEAVEALLELYGEGLARMVELVAHLLLLHGLHPGPLEARVRGARDEVRPYLASHGGGVELLGVEEGVVRLRMEGSCDGCPSSAATLTLAIEDAVHKAAPDVVGIEADGAVRAAAPPGLIQLEIHTPLPPAPVPPAWSVAGGMPDLVDGRPLVREVAGEPVLFTRVDGSVYAYRPRCPACDASLDRATVDRGELTCATCGHAYDVVLAGRCRDAPELHLEPVPLLEDDAGLVRVALGSAA